MKYKSILPFIFLAMSFAGTLGCLCESYSAGLEDGHYDAEDIHKEGLKLAYKNGVTDGMILSKENDDEEASTD